VKYMCAIGSLIGVKPLVFVAFPVMIVSGAIYASLYLVYKGELISCFRRMGEAITCSVLGRTLVTIPAETGSAATHVFPFAIAISTGAFAALYVSMPPGLLELVNTVSRLLGY